MGQAGGWVAPGYEAVRDAFAAAQAEDERRAQLCVYRHGEPVVDLWAGPDSRWVGWTKALKDVAGAD